MSGAIEIKINGAIFDDRAHGIVEDIIDEFRFELSNEAWRYMVDSTKVFKKPTGYYKSQIKIQRQGLDTDLITDSEVVYGPWLEYGGGKFAGYQLWKKAFLWAEESSDKMATKYNKKIVERLS